MPVTNYPQGLSSFGFNLVGSGPYLGAGNVFWVSSINGTDASGRGTDPTRPFKTINFAISKCSAPAAPSVGGNTSRVGGDFIFVLPGHVEQISAAGTAASPGPVGSISINVAGVTIVGLGNNAQRPLIQWTATAGQILGAANNIRFENIVFDMASQIASVVAAFKITGTGYQFNNCLVLQSTSAQAALIGFQLAAGWSDFSMNHTQITSNGGLPFAAGTGVFSVAAGDKFQLRDCYVNADASNALIDGGAAIITNVLIEYGEYINVNSGSKPIIKGNNSSSGMVREAMIQLNGGTVASVVSGTGWVFNQCFGKGTASGTASGIVVPGANTY